MELAALLNPQAHPGVKQKEMTPDEQLWQLTYSMIFLTVSGFVLNWLYRAIDYAYVTIRKKLVCSITLQIRSYLTQAGYLKGCMTDLKIQPKKKKNAHWWDYEEFEKQKTERIQVEYLPGPGKKLWLSINEQQTLLTGWENKPTKYETLSICTYGTDTKILKELVQEAINYSEKEDHQLVKIYQVHRWGGSWQLVQQKKPRSMESVVLDTDIAGQIINDISKFMESGPKYVDKGVPYRRGYLLYGPPGTGKTSFVQVIAGQLQMDICYLNLASGNLDDDGLINLLGQAPERAIILLEDIDAVFVERVCVQEENQRQGVSFSGLLNALDGVRSQEGRVVIMTTNHKEKLDAALLRPGRADMHFELNYASENQMKNLLKKFYPDATEQQTQAFANQIPEFKLSMAKLQGHFLKYRDNIDEAIEKAHLLFEIEQQIKDMSIDEWLRRLNLSQYAPKFKKLSNIKTVNDLKYVQEGDLIEFGITVMTDRKRVLEMMSGNNQEVKQLFSMQNSTQSRQIVALFVSNVEEINEFVELIGEEQITGYQLRDIFDSTKDLDTVKLKIHHRIQHNQAIAKGQIRQEIEDDEAEEDQNSAKTKKSSTTTTEEKKKEEYLSENVEDFLKQLGFEECIPKLAEHDINDPDVFFGLSEDEMISLLEIKTEGKKYKFKKQMKELKEQQEKKKAEQEEEKMKRRTGETFELLQKRSSIIY